MICCHQDNLRREEERRRQDISEENFQLKNGSKCNPDVKTEIQNSIQDSSTTSQLTHQNVFGSHISSSSFINNFQSDSAWFKLSNLSFWLTESAMNVHTAMKYTLPSDITMENVLLSDLNRLNKMRQPGMVYDQMCMLVDDMNQTASQCLPPTGTGIRRASFPSITYYDGPSALGKFGFEKLFATPLTLKTDSQSAECTRSSSTSSLSDTNDKEDLCDILDDVYLKHGCLTYYINT